MKDIAFSVVTIGFIVVAITCVSNGHYIKQLTGQTVASMQQMKQDCEKDLKRSQQCVIVVSAEIAKEK